MTPASARNPRGGAARNEVRRSEVPQWSRGSDGASARNPRGGAARDEVRRSEVPQWSRGGDGASARNLRRTERGAGTVLAMVVVLVVVAVLWAAGALAAGVTARRSAAAAADLAALAVAQNAAHGTVDPCSAGQRVADANGGQLVDCVVMGHDAEVVVEVAVADGPFAWVPDGRRRARAGPSRVVP